MKLKKILSLSILVFVLTIFSNVKAETFTADKEWSKMKPGDVIYFDNSSTKWSKVYIYIWEKQGNTDKDKYKEWDKADEMQKVEGTDNIYSFTVPDDMTSDKYNMLIFKNGNNGDQNQTIDLGFIEEGFAYKINSDNTGKRVGYWYLYDTSDITKRLESAKKYQADKQYYTSESYGDLDNYIQDVVDKLNKEILLEEQKQDNGNGTGKYYIDIDVTLANIDNVVDGLKTDKSILENKVKEIEEKLEQDKDKYTDESIKELQDILGKAKELLESDDINVEDLKTSLNNIDVANNNLEEKVIENNTNTSDKDTTGKSKSDTIANTNPKTYDGIIGYAVLGIISLGLTGFTVKKYLFR